MVRNMQEATAGTSGSSWLNLGGGTFTVSSSQFGPLSSVLSAVVFPQQSRTWKWDSWDSDRDVTEATRRKHNKENDHEEVNMKELSQLLRFWFVCSCTCVCLTFLNYVFLFHFSCFQLRYTTFSPVCYNFQ